MDQKIESLEQNNSEADTHGQLSISYASEKDPKIAEK